MKKGYVLNLEEETLQNEDYRRVLYTSAYSQLVVMSLEPGEEIGEEVHGLDQFIRIEAGKGEATLNGDKHDVSDGSAVVVPAGASHNVVNTGEKPLKIYTVYSPPEHKDGVVQATKADEFEEHFDGTCSE